MPLYRGGHVRALHQELYVAGDPRDVLVARSGCDSEHAAEFQRVPDRSRARWGPPTRAAIRPHENRARWSVPNCTCNGRVPTRPLEDCAISLYFSLRRR